MPTYEYACRGCERRFEVVQSFSDAPLTRCESCGGELRKVFSAAGLIFKGSGWHVKDYASGGSASSRGAATSGSEAGPSGGSTSTDGSAPAPAAPATPTTTAAPAGGTRTTSTD